MRKRTGSELVPLMPAKNERIPSSKAVQSVAADYNTRAAREVLTPFEWRHVGIERRGKTFRLLSLFSRMDISARDLTVAKLLPDLKLSGLTLTQAHETGARVETAMRLSSSS